MAATASRTAGEFLCQYLELSGFNSQDGVFMVCKELLDNAVDACRKRIKCRFPLLAGGEVELAVSLGESAVAVACRDTGAGIDCGSVSALGDVFASSKANDAKAGGEFGIGLKAIMLHSQRDLKEPLKVRIRMNENEVWSFGLSLSEAAAAPSVQNFTVEKASLSEWAWVTEFSISLSPIWDAKKEMMLEDYCAVYTQWCQQLKINTNLVFKGQRRFEAFTHSPPESLAAAAAASAADAPEAPAAAAAAAAVEVKAQVLSLDAEDDQKEIYLIRSFNGMPLLPAAAAACLVTSCLSSFLIKFGPLFGIEEFSAKAAAEEVCCGVCGGQIAFCFRVHTPEETEWNRIVLAVNITSEKALFSSFAKSCLQGDKKLEVELFSLFEKIFAKLKSQIPRAFRSSKDLQKEKSREVFAPSLAASLAAVISTSPNFGFRSSAAALLDLQVDFAKKPKGVEERNCFSTRKRAKTKTAFEVLRDKTLELIL